MKKFIVILILFLSAATIKAVDVKDYRPTKFRFTGDVQKARTVVGDGNRLLFQLKNIQQAGAPDIRHLENKYSNGVIVTADTTSFGIDIVNIYWPQFGKEAERTIRYIAPVFSCYSFYNGDGSGQLDTDTKPELFVVMKDFKSIRYIYKPSDKDNPSMVFTKERFESYQRNYGETYEPDPYEYGTPTMSFPNVEIKELYEVDDWFSSSDLYSYNQSSSGTSIYEPEGVYYPDSCTNIVDTSTIKNIYAFGDLVSSGIFNVNVVAQVYRYDEVNVFSYERVVTQSGMVPSIWSYGFGDDVFKINEKNIFNSKSDCYYYSYRTETHVSGIYSWVDAVTTDTRRVDSDERLRIKLRDYIYDISVYLCNRYTSNNVISAEYSSITIPWVGIYSWNGEPVLLFCYRTSCTDKWGAQLPNKGSGKVGYIMCYKGNLIKSPIEYDALSSINAPHELYDISGKTIDYQGTHYYASNMLRLVEVTETYKE